MSSTTPPTKRRVSPRLLVIAGFFVLVVGILFASTRGTAQPTSAEVSRSDVISVGRAVYVAQCASCHGGNLEGQPNWQQPRADGTMPAPPHDETGHTWHHNDQSLFTTVKFGSAATAPEGYNASMPGFGNVLTDDEIWAVLTYIKSTWPPELQAAQREGHE